MLKLHTKKKLAGMSTLICWLIWLLIVKVENMRLTENGYFLDPLKKDLEHVLKKVGLGTISDIRPVTEGYGKEISKYSMKFWS